jgi:hypothetical protein
MDGFVLIPDPISSPVPGIEQDADSAPLPPPSIVAPNNEFFMPIFVLDLVPKPVNPAFWDLWVKKYVVENDEAVFLYERRV